MTSRQLAELQGFITSGDESLRRAAQRYIDRQVKHAREVIDAEQVADQESVVEAAISILCSPTMGLKKTDARRRAEAQYKVGMTIEDLIRACL